MFESPTPSLDVACLTFSWDSREMECRFSSESVLNYEFENERWFRKMLTKYFISEFNLDQTFCGGYTSDFIFLIMQHSKFKR